MGIKRISLFGLLILSLFSLASCGWFDTSSTSGETSVTGTFIDDPVEGLVYHCSSGDFHETNAAGEFTCFAGDTVTFYLGANQIGPVPASSTIVTPYTLFPDDPDAAINLAKLLQSLDMDNDPSNGIVMNDAKVALLPNDVDFSSPTFTNDIEAALGITLVSDAQAQQTLNESIAQLGDILYPDSSFVPVADAGADQSVTSGATIILDGSGSSARVVSELIYAWGIASKPAQSAAQLVGWDSSSATFVADVDGEYVISLLVVFQGFTHLDQVTITVGNSVPVPVAPQGLQATAGDSQIALSWSASSGASSYTVYWNTSGSVSTSDASIDAGSNTQISHTALTNGTTYYYRVAASNATGEGALSTEVSATPVAAVSIPAAPQSVQASAGDAEVTLSWSASTGASSYMVYWNTSGSVSTSDASINAGSSTQISHTSLTNGATYYYRVTATNIAGVSALSTEVSATPDAVVSVPVAPQGVQATAGDTQLTLSWNAVSGADSYTVYWNTSGSVSTSDASIDAGTNTQMPQAGLTNGTTYYYRVTATNTAGEGALSSEVSATPTAPATEVPGVPTGLQAIAGDAQVALSWDAVTGATSYTLYWATSGASGESGSYDTGSNIQYTDTGLTNGTAYYYRVTASNAAGEGTTTTTVSAVPLTPIPQTLRITVGDGHAELSWAAVSGTGSYNYTVYWNTSGGVTTSDASIYIGSGTEYTHTGLSNGITYYYRVSAAGAAGEGELSKEAFSTQPSTWQWANPLPQGNSIEDIAWDGSQYVAVGPGGLILTSPNGATWTRQNSGNANYLSGITWNGSLFVAASDYGAVLTSPDGTTWTSQVVTTGAGLFDVAWNGSLFAAVGGSGTILSSPDGTTWTARTSGTANHLIDVSWSDSQFVAVGSSGTILTSPGGITWTSRSAAEDNTWNSVTYGGGLFVAVAGNGTYRSMTSSGW